jgi:hypothetical protein
LAVAVRGAVRKRSATTLTTLTATMAALLRAISPCASLLFPNRQPDRCLFVYVLADR